MKNIIWTFCLTCIAITFLVGAVAGFWLISGYLLLHFGDIATITYLIVVLGGVSTLDVSIK